MIGSGICFILLVKSINGKNKVPFSINFIKLSYLQASAVDNPEYEVSVGVYSCFIFAPGKLAS